MHVLDWSSLCNFIGERGNFSLYNSKIRKVKGGHPCYIVIVLLLFLIVSFEKNLPFPLNLDVNNQPTFPRYGSYNLSNHLFYRDALSGNSSKNLSLIKLILFSASFQVAPPQGCRVEVINDVSSRLI